MLLTVYDGVETIMGNKIMLEDNGVSIFLDFVINFNIGNLYFKEFLVHRTWRGLLDMFHTGLLPAIQGIYRSFLGRI